MRKALNELIDTSLDFELVDNIKTFMLDNECIRAVHSLRTRSMGGQGYIDAEIRVDPRLTVSEAHYIAFSLERQIKVDFPQIIDVRIHVDPLAESEHDAVTDLPSRSQLLQEFQTAWKNIPCADQIESIHLHYLKDQVEIDISLPESCFAQNQSAQVDRMIQQTRQLPHIGQVRVFFSRK